MRPSMEPMFSLGFADTAPSEQHRRRLVWVGVGGGMGVLVAVLAVFLVLLDLVPGVGADAGVRPTPTLAPAHLLVWQKVSALSIF